MSMGSAGESSRSAVRRDGDAKPGKALKSKTKSKSSQDAALQALQAHFTGAFDVEQPIKPVASRERVEKGKSTAKRGSTAEKISTSQSARAVDKSSARSVSDGSSAPISRRAERPRTRTPQTVVFGADSEGSLSAGRAPGWRKFMSSKIVSGSDKQEADTQVSKGKKRASGDDQDGEDDGGDGTEAAAEEAKNLTNDRALSELLSTTLFAPGAQDTRRANGKQKLGNNDTMARLLELSKPTLTSHASSVGRGLGAATLKAQQMNRMPATMRHGMRAAEQTRADREVERQKELGNYHQSIKGLVSGRSREGMDLIMGATDKNRLKRTRQKGLSMGMGSFQNGTLRINDSDVSRINSAGRGSSSRGRGGRGGRGGSSGNKKRRM